MAATLAIYLWAFEQHRRMVPAAWSRNNGLSTTICLVIVSLLAAGLCFRAASMIDPAGTLASMSAAGWALLAAEIVAIVVIGPRLARRARAAAERQPASVTPMSPRGPGDTPPVNTSTGAVRRRKAA